MSDDDRGEATAQLENEMIAAAQALVEDYGYSAEDLIGIIRLHHRGVTTRVNA